MALNAGRDHDCDIRDEKWLRHKVADVRREGDQFGNQIGPLWAGLSIFFLGLPLLPRDTRDSGCEVAGDSACQTGIADLVCLTAQVALDLLSGVRFAEGVFLKLGRLIFTWRQTLFIGRRKSVSVVRRSPRRSLSLGDRETDDGAELAFRDIR